MIYAFDTCYKSDSAQTACVGFEEWTADSPSTCLKKVSVDILPYESGAFYKRELPCIIQIIDDLDVEEGDIFLVDGYVVLDDYGKNGLGGYLFEHYNEKFPVIGVAKNNFAHLNSYKRRIYRGESKKALFITSVGVELDLAANYIQSMKGLYRMPTLLRLVDQICREPFKIS